MMTMSVELAIQRELAYRAKIGKLLLSPYDATVLEDLIPLEGQTSTGSPSCASPTISETTWQAPTNDLKFNLLPPQLHEVQNSSFKVQPTSANPSQNPIPRPYSSPSPMHSGTRRISPANSDLSPPSHLHEQDKQIDYTFSKVQSSSSNPNQRENSNWTPMLPGQKRKMPTNSLEFPSPPQHHGPRNQIDYTCKICQVHCDNFFNYKQHIRGRKHRGKQQELKYLKDQLGDRKHKDIQAKSKLAKKGGRGSEIAKPKYWCKLCNIWCIDNDSLTRHNEGKKHILKLHEIEKKRAMPNPKEMDGI